MELIRTQFKIEYSDKTILSQMAKEEGTSMSALIRRLIRVEAKRRNIEQEKRHERKAA